MPIDPTTPNIGRIYDYMLGGHNHFESDRQAAEAVLQVFPAYPRWARLNRWFLQLVAEQWRDQGVTQVLDLGSGIPTQGHLHTILSDATIVYTDHDPVAVAYARELVQTIPWVHFAQVDVRDAAALVTLAEQHLDRDQPLAIGCVGIAYFMDDAAVQQVLQTLHAWAAPGSVLALTAPYSAANTANTRQTAAFFKRQNAEIFLRDAAQMQALAQPWQATQYQPLTEWLAVRHLMEATDYEADTEFYGGVFVPSRPAAPGGGAADGPSASTGPDRAGLAVSGDDLE